MQDLNDMYYFAKVIEHGGFMAAGRALGIPKSRLSRRIKELESSLNVQLLHRTTRKLALTDIGTAFLRHCQTVLEEAKAAKEEIARVHTTPRGTIRVSAPMAIAQFLLAPYLAKFIEQYPEVNVLLDVSNRRVDLIEEGIDVALRVRMGALEDTSLVMRTLGRSHSILLASPEFLKQHGMPQTPADLVNYPMLSLLQPNEQYTWHFTSDEGKVIDVVAKPRLLTDDMVVLRKVVIAGQGMVALPLLLIHEELKQGKLVRVLPNWHLPYGLLHAVYPSRRGLLPAIRVFIDFLSENVHEQSSDFDVDSLLG